MHGSARLDCARLGLLFAAAGVLGCTTMKMPMLPDATLSQDAEVDAGTRDDGAWPPPVIERCTPEGMGSTIGASCTSNADCDDGCFCNGAEMCDDGTCVAGTDPCADTIDCTADACLEEADRCFHDPEHERCSNGNACDGIELCDVRMGCLPGTPPYCNDEDSCTIDRCDPEMGCVFQARDLDGDGYNDGRCGGDDCDDDPRYGTAIHPGAIEVCTNRRDDDCDGMRDYNDPDCVPPNDTCESAVFLPGPGTYSGSTSTLMGDYSLGCRGSGPDAVFRFTLTEPRDVRVTVVGGGSGVGLALRPWDACATGPDEKCTSGSPPSLLRRSLPAGEYAIIVQSNTPGAPFDLNLMMSDPTEIPPVDVCDADTLDICGGVPCTTMVGATFTGMFEEVEDNYTPSCGFAGNRDAAYKFTIDSPKDITIVAGTGGSGVTYITLTTDCGSPSGTFRCEASWWGSAAELRQRELPPGTYYVLIETDQTSASGWSMTVTITDPVPRTPGDACSVPIDISEATLGGGGSGMVDVSGLDLDSGTSCGGSSTSSGYRDANFFFDLPEMRDVTLTIEGADSFSTYYAALQTACGVASSTLRCWSGWGMNSQSWRSLPAGRYFVTVATSSTSGILRASIQTSPPTPVPPNDRCEGAIVLTSGTSRRDTTNGFEDDAPGGGCTWGSNPDAFYRFTLATRSDVVINVRDADGGSSSFWLTLRDACGTGAELACASSTGFPSTATVSVTLDPGTYYLQVESNSFDTSDYYIFTTFFPVP